jgi:dolichol-phosphate mannosyltransferase
MKYSVVIPVYNEAGNIAELMVELKNAMSNLYEDWEVIWVNDGSTDHSKREILQACHSVENSRNINFESRGGQSKALWAGINAAIGQYIITLDGDGQNDPADILSLIPMLNFGDMIVGNRVHRRDSCSKRYFSFFANRFRNLITRSSIPDSGCALKVFRRELITRFIPFHGMHRFLTTLAEINGGKVVSVHVRHRARVLGKSKYTNFHRILLPILDCCMLAWLNYRRINVQSAIRDQPKQSSVHYASPRSADEATVPSKHAES